MAQRALFVILGATLCATALPGCAHLLGPASNSSATNDTAGPQTGAAIQQRQEHYPALEESEPRIFPPPRPDQAALTSLDVSQSAGQADQARQKLPPGMNLPEFTGPPPVQPPLNIPQLPLITRISAQGSTPDLEQDNSPVLHVSSDVAPPPDRREELVLALDYLLKNHPDEALQHLRHLDEDTKGIIMRLMSAQAVINDHSIDKLTASEAVALEESIQGLLVALRNHSQLMIDTLFLAKELKPVTPFEDRHVFQPSDQLLVYVELHNVAGERDGNHYISKFVGNIRIKSVKGEVDYGYNKSFRGEPPVQSLKANSDCARLYRPTLPPAIPPGRYTLTMEIVDETRQPYRVATKSIEFIVGPIAGQ